MKKYAEMFAASKDEREAELKDSTARSINLADSKTVLQKIVAKLLVAMTNAGELQSGDMRKQAQKITGHDIRETLQNVYELVNVFAAIEKGDIKLTEDEFDTLDTSKLALLSPFLTKPELKEKLGDAVEKAKTGTAKEIRDLKPKAKKGDTGDTGDTGDKTNSAPIPFGFMATDIYADQALVHSEQFARRIRADMEQAMDAGDDATFMKMIEKFGKFYSAACKAVDMDPLDFLSELSSQAARPATGQVVDAPALEAPALEAAAA